MILTKQRAKNRRKKFVTTIGVIAIVIALVFGIKAYLGYTFNAGKEELKSLSQQFSEKAEEFTPSEEEVKNVTKETIYKIVDFVEKGSEYVNENISMPLYELSNEMAEEQLEKMYGNKESSPQALVPTDNNFEKVSLWACIDGDTIKVVNSSNETITVRLIGVNTPESVHPDSERNNEYGVMASDWTKDYIHNYLQKYNTNDMWLEYDEGRYDEYGRTLAYLWLSEDVDTSDITDIRNYMLNAILVDNGYAEIMTITPNTKYSQHFYGLMENAESNGIGLWQYEGAFE